jgi:CO/xanthine dehydrogenase Mo-binding subunit
MPKSRFRGRGAPRVITVFPAIQVETLCAYTNQVPCTQTRTPGSPQTTFAVESQIDIIARELAWTRRIFV